MAAPVIITSQFLVSQAAYVQNDTPSGTFAATKLTLANTEAAQVGGTVSIVEGVNTETPKIIAVLSATEVVVEELVNTYTVAATVTFLGRTNTPDPTSQTLLKNATGLKVNGSKWKCEVHQNPLAKDVLAMWKYIKDDVIRKDGAVGLSANLDFNLNQAVDLLVEVLASNPGVGVNTGRLFYTTDDHKLKCVINAVIEALVTETKLHQHVPVGTILPLAGNTVSAPYISATGQTLARVGTYADLYAAIGTAWGNGDGSGTTFTNPDLRGRALIGAGAGAGLTARTLAQLLGVEEHTLTSSQMPRHRHEFSFSLGGVIAEDGGARYAPQSANSFTEYAGGSGGDTQPHQNMPPSAVVNWIIKYTK